MADTPAPESITDPTIAPTDSNDAALPNSVPDYLQAADNHSVAAGNGSWISGALESIGNAPKFWGLAIGSGVTGVLNTGIAVANWFNNNDDKIQSINYGQWINDYDSDLGKYYKDNANSIDTWGFVATSFAPGLAGIKGLNLAQAALRVGVADGMVGAGMSAGTKLLIPAADSYIASAATQIASVNARYALLTKGGLAAIGTKTGQAVLESAAFEGAALATQFKNPYVDQMSAGDLAINSVLNVVAGGAIGGLISIPGVLRAVDNKVIALDATGSNSIRKIALTNDNPANLQAASQFLNRAQLEKFVAEAKAGPAADAVLPDGFNAAIAAKNVNNANEAIGTVNNNIRMAIQQMTPNKEFSNTVADTILKGDSVSQANLLAGTDSIIRYGDRQLLTAQASKEPGQLSLDLRSKLISTEDPSIQWNKLWPTDDTTTIIGTPTAPTLADSVKMLPGKSIEDSVNAVARSFNHQFGQVKKGVEPQIFDVFADGANLAEVQSRYLAASRVKLSGPQDVVVTDLPHLEASYAQFDNVGQVTLKQADGTPINTFDNKQDLFNAIKQQKSDQITAAIKTANRRRVTGLSMDEIAARANIDPGYLIGSKLSQNLGEDIFFTQAQAAKMGITPEQMFYKPQYFGTKASNDFSGKLTDLHLDAEYRVRAARQASQSVRDNAVEEAGALYGQSEFTNAATGSKTISNITRMLPEAQVMLDSLGSANRFGAGSRLFSFQNGNYGSFSAAVAHVGTLKGQMDSAAREMIMNRLDNSRRLLANDSAVAIEYGATKELVARSKAPLVLERGQIYYEDKALRKLDEAGNEIPAITLRNPGTAEVWASHSELNAGRLSGYKTLRAAEGLEDTRMPTRLYAIKPDPSKTPFHVMVVDPTLTGTQAGRTTMIHAATARDLEMMVSKVKSEFPEWNIISNQKSEDYHRALGDYTYDKTLHDNHIDTAMKSRGIMSSPVPRTDGKYLADELTTWHLNQSRAYNAEIVQVKYADMFKELEDLSKTQGGLDTSKYPDMYTALNAGVKSNAYMQYAKSALNISNISDHPLLTNISRTMDAQVSNLWNIATGALRSFKGVKQGELDLVHKIFKEQGFQTAYYDAAMHLYANHPAGTQVLSKFIRGAQSILATTFLRMDWLNALNNGLGSVVLTSSELNFVMNKIKAGDANQVGKLAELQHFFTDVPGTGDTMMSPTKMIANSLRRLLADATGPEAGKLTQRYSDAGYIKSLQSQQTRDTLQNLTLTGAESPTQLTGKLQKAFDAAKKLGDIGEKVTVNRFIEHANRFIAADIMTQLTDYAVAKGILSPKEAGLYTRTFVDRTQVNLNAAQRPLAFQGPIGMATGLFQSYQFNLMQQMFRYIEPGNRKTAAFLMGMQSSIYGMAGLPGFQQLNGYIASLNGNTEKLGLTNILTRDAGYDVANLLLYGMPSNILRTNLWTRGDMTPQNPTILPTGISDIPMVTMYGGFLKNLKNTAENLYQGANLWPTFLSGLEHNSISRPLAGLAQTLRGLRNGTVYSTDGAGNILSSNDLWSLTTLGRLAGGKPMDEAIVRTESRRLNLIRQADQTRLQEATKALKISLQDNGTVGQNQFDSVMDTFVTTGHKSAQFNSWMMKQYLNANVSQAQKLRQRLGDPYSQSLQQMMGGAEDSAGMNFSVP